MRTILVIDDQLSVRATIGYLLEAQGYNVLLAASGAEAFAISTPFDLALIDIYMPAIDGFAVCRALRERMAQDGRYVPVLMMTAAWTSEAAAKAAADGAAGLVRKPFTCEELVAEVERAMTGPVPPFTPNVPVAVAAA
jgi:CheY-like chemotaxis protein